MKRKLAACLLILLAFHAPVILAISSFHCYKESTASRALALFPGIYDPDKLDLTACRDMCADLGSLYAGTTAGRFCFCFDSSPDTPAVDSSQCALACSDTSRGEDCGGADRHINMYAVPTRLSSVKVQPNDTYDVTPTFSARYFNVVAEPRADGIIYRMDYDDGTGMTTVNITGMFHNTYTMPGEYMVTVQASDILQKETVHSSVKIFIDAPVAHLQLTCPEVICSQRPIQCNATLLSGSHSQAFVDFGDGTSEIIFFQDPLWKSTGPPISPHGTYYYLSETSTLYSMPDMTFPIDGTLLAWEFFAANTGTVSFLVLTPSCSSTYCYKTNNCSNPCPDDIAITCSSTSQFCPDRKICVADMKTWCPVAQHRLAGAMPYTISSIHEYTVSRVGWQIYNIGATDLVDVKKGDIIGYSSGTIGTIATRFIESGEVGDKKLGFTASLYVGQVKTTPTTTTDLRHLLRAIVSQPSQIALNHIYERTGNYTIKMNVSNLYITGWQVAAVDIALSSGVSEVTINSPLFAATGSDVIFSLFPSTGNSAFTWHFDDGFVLKTDTETISHIFTTRGEHKVNVTIASEGCSNDTSNDTTIIIQDTVANMFIQCPAVQVGVSAVAWLTVSSGSDYYCDLDSGYGKGAQVAVATYSGIPFVNKSLNVGVYAVEGTFTVTVMCYNNVSQNSTSATIDVQNAISGLKIHDTTLTAGQTFQLDFSLDEGTDPKFTLFFMDIKRNVNYDSVTRLGTSENIIVNTPGIYQANISAENLVSFLETFALVTVDVEITRPRCDADKLLAAVGEKVNISVGIEAGSSVNVTWHYSDGSDENTFTSPVGVDWSDDKWHIHVFNAPGTFPVRILFSNPVNQQLCIVTVQILNPVRDIVLQSNTPITMKMNANSTVAIFYFHILPDSSPPSNATVRFNYGDGQTDLQVFNQYTRYRHAYSVSGQYVVNATIFNQISSVVYTHIVDVVFAMSGLHVKCEPCYAEVGELITFSVSMETGDGVTLNFDWGNQQDISTAIMRKARTPYEVDQLNCTFSTAGVFTVTVLAVDVANNTEKYVLNVTTQYPVTDDFTITTTQLTATGPTEVTLFYDSLGPKPTDPTVTFNWGDGSQTTAPVTIVNMPYSLMNSHQFTAGHYFINVTIENLVSSRTLYTAGGSYEPILHLNVTAMYKPELPLNSPYVSGLGDNHTFFPLDRNVTFLVFASTDAIEEYVLQISNEDASYYRNVLSDSNEISHEFSQVGAYEVNVTAKNQFFSASAQTKLHIVKRILGVRITDNGLGTKADEVKRFTIEFDSLSSDACVLVDFGDGEAESYAKHAKYCGNLAVSAVVYNLSSPLMVVHKYTANGQYTLHVIGRNYISTASDSMRFTVSNVKCRRPELTAMTPALSFLAPLSFKRKDSFHVHVISRMANCSALLTSESRKWRVFSADDNSGNATSEFNISSLTTSHMSDLTIPARFLPYGLYKFTHYVKMVVDVDVVYQNEVSVFVRITESAIVAKLLNSGVTGVRRGWGEDVTFEPELHSRDPDLLESDDQGFTSFTWFCWEMGSTGPSVPMNTVSLDVIKAAPMPYTYDAIIKGLTANRGGCFRQGSQLVGTDAGTLTFNTANMRLNATYTLAVVVHKGSRYSTAEIQLTIITGQPPDVAISCKDDTCRLSRSGYIINPSNRVPLTGACAPQCPQDETKYEWRMYRESLRGDWVEIREFGQYVSSTNYSEISIAPDLFQYGFSLYSKLFTYRVSLSVHTSRRAVGQSDLVIKLNPGPIGGSCSINAHSALVTMSTLWTIQCDGWYDTDGIANYQFYSTFKEDQVLKQLYFGPEARIITQLQPGPVYDDYYEDIWVAITDTTNSRTVHYIDRVQVKPGSELAESMDQLEEMIDSQEDAVQSFFVYQRMAYLLNLAENKSLTDYDIPTASKLTSTGYGPMYADKVDEGGWYEDDEKNIELKEKYEEERDWRAKMRSKIILSIKPIPMHTLHDVQLASSAINVVTDSVEEISRESQFYLVESVSKMTNLLNGLSEETDYDELISTATSIMAVCGKVLEASSFAIDNGLLQDLEDATRTEDYFYDTDLESKRERLDHLSSRRAVSRLKVETNSIVQTKAAVSIVSGIRESIEKIARMLRESQVIGEDPIKMRTPKLSLTISKAPANQIDRRLHNEGRGSFNLPAWCQLVPQKNNCSEDEVISLVVTSTPSNAYEHLRRQKKVSYTSSIMSIDFYDENGHAVPVPHTQEPIEISIPHDHYDFIEKPNNITAIFPNSSQLFFHSFNITHEEASLHIEMRMEDADARFLLLLRFGTFPVLTEEARQWDYVQTLPLSDIEVSSGVDPNVAVLNNRVVNNYKGKVVIGVRQLDDEEGLYDADNPPRPFNTSRSSFTTAYTLRTYTSGCYFYREDRIYWDSAGCVVGPRTTPAQTDCRCTHATMFGAGLVVQPNKIDWQFVFSNMDFYKNPTLYVTEIIIAVVYILVAIWARRQDRKDLEKLGVTPMADNKPGDQYMYEVLVITGSCRNASTDSKVQFTLSGDYDETEVRSLSDEKRRVLQRGATDVFLMTTPRSLGDLNYMRIWHDNSGEGQHASWFLRRIVVHDLFTKMKYHFIANRWFAVEMDDGQVDRVLPLADDSEMAADAHALGHTARRNIADEHLWFSVIGRPPRSRFSRLQRVSCCLCLLFTSMLANAIFYGRAAGSGQHVFSLGPFALSPEQIYVGVVCNLIVFPVNFLLVVCFRKTRSRKKRPSRMQQAIDECRKANDNVTAKTDTNFTDINKQPWTDPVPVTKTKRRFSLPWWFHIIAWLLLWIVVFVSAAFVTFYGIMFQDEKCKKWITSMLVSFVTSVFLTQPIKVFLLALFFSLIFKKISMDSDDDDDLQDEEEPPELGKNEQWMHYIPDSDVRPMQPRQTTLEPPDEAKLEAAREKRLLELKMYDILREIILYLAFLWILLVIGYGLRDPNAFLMKTALSNVFIAKRMNNYGSPILPPAEDFRKVRTWHDFYDWLTTTFVPNLRAGVWYNGAQPIFQRGFLGDRTSRILGYATLRQLRVNEDRCRVMNYFNQIIENCYDEYGLLAEDKEDYLEGWRKPLQGENVSRDNYPYIYRSATELDGYPVWGGHAIYSGGGYVAELRGTVPEMLQTVEELRQGGWIDRRTRAIFVELSVYNVGVNLFGVVTIVAELMVTGGVSPYYRIEPARLLSYLTPATLLQLTCQAVYLMFVVGFIIKELRKVVRNGCRRYVCEPWNWCELAVIALSIGSVAVYIYRMIITRRLTRRFALSHGNDYVKFQYVGYWNEVLTVMIGGLVFLANIKFIRLLRFNKRMGLLASTLRYGAKPLAFFSIMFAIVFTAYSQVFHFVYMAHLSNFMTLIRAAETCLQMLIGKFNFDEMRAASPVLGPLAFFLYIFTVYYILINMFLIILNEAFARVRRDIALQSNDYEIVDFVLLRFRQWTGLSRLVGGTQNKTAPVEEKSVIAPAQPAFEMQIDNFPATVDRLLDCISAVYFKRDKFDSIFEAQDDTGKKKKGKRGMMMHTANNSKKKSLTHIEQIQRSGS